MSPRSASRRREKPINFTHMFRVMGSVDVPRTGVAIAANLKYFSGKPWAATAPITVPQTVGDQRVLLEPRGSRRLSSQTLPGGKVVVHAFSIHEDLADVAAGAVRDRDRVAIFRREICDPRAVWRPGQAPGVLAQKGSRLAAHEWHEPQPPAVAGISAEPDVGPVGRKPDVSGPSTVPVVLLARREVANPFSTDLAEKRAPRSRAPARWSR